MKQGEFDSFIIHDMKTKEIEPSIYAKTDLQLLLKEPHKDETFVMWRTWAVINFILDTGVRAETVCSVHMRDISGNAFSLFHTICKRPITITLGDFLLPVLDKYIQMFRFDAGLDDYLFPAINDTRLTVNPLNHDIRDYIFKRGVDVTSIHAFRATYAIMSSESWQHLQ